MDPKTIVAEVESWPAESRMRLVEEIWNGLLEEGFVPLSDHLEAELDHRMAALDANPDDVIGWESIVDHARRPR